MDEHDENRDAVERALEVFIVNFLAKEVLAAFSSHVQEQPGDGTTIGMSQNGADVNPSGEGQTDTSASNEAVESEGD